MRVMIVWFAGLQSCRSANYFLPQKVCQRRRAGRDVEANLRGGQLSVPRDLSWEMLRRRYCVDLKPDLIV